MWSIVLVLAAGRLVAQEPQTMKLWPGKVPGETGNIPAEGFVPAKAPQKGPSKNLTNISEPTITVYRPARDKDTGTAIVIAPGGGYNVLAWEHEGTQVAEWLQKIGITGVLLKYRVPRRPDQPKDQPPIGALQDAQRAVSLVRSKAGQWELKSDRIGFLGFSAGGHLTAWVSNSFDKRAYEPIDKVDEVSSRPDFAVLIYPGGVVSKTSPDQLRPEIRVSKQTPPSFLVVATDDKGSLPSTLGYFDAVQKAGVPVELHVYSVGGHGFGMRQTGNPAATWPDRCADWMRKQGYLQ
jgi:acetyl esterase/lipase